MKATALRAFFKTVPFPRCVYKRVLSLLCTVPRMSSASLPPKGVRHIYASEFLFLNTSWAFLPHKCRSPTEHLGYLRSLGRGSDVRNTGRVTNLASGRTVLVGGRCYSSGSECHNVGGITTLLRWGRVSLEWGYPALISGDTAAVKSEGDAAQGSGRCFVFLG